MARYRKISATKIMMALRISMFATPVSEIKSLIVSVNTRVFSPLNSNDDYLNGGFSAAFV
jgi:hypothetical protein